MLGVVAIVLAIVTIVNPTSPAVGVTLSIAIVFAILGAAVLVDWQRVGRSKKR